MTVERKEPSLSDLGSTRDEPEVSTPRNSSSNAAPRQAAVPSRTEYRDQPPSSYRPAPVVAPAATSRSALAPVALVLALAGVGLAGFSHWQLMKVQQQATTAETRLAELEQRLALADDESTQSVSTLQTSLRETRQQLEAANGEIRKLWDARNTNRTAIGENKTQIAAAAKAAQNAATAAQSAANAAAEAKKLAQTQDANIKALTNSVALQTEQAGVVSDSVNAQKKQVREAVDKANAVDSQVKQLQNDLAGRVKRNEDAIKAIDSHRVSVNRDIIEIKGRLNAGGQ